MTPPPDPVTPSSAPVPSSRPAPDAPADFRWEVQPEARALLEEWVETFLDRCPQARTLAERMLAETSTRFLDWVDHVRAPESADAIARLEGAGFSARPVPGAAMRYVHEGAVLPPVVLGAGPLLQVGIKVERVADFLATWEGPNDAEISGDVATPLRRAIAFRGENAEMLVVERHGYLGLATLPSNPRRSLAVLRHLEAFRRRRRAWPTEEQAFAHAQRMIDEAIADLATEAPAGTRAVDLVCDLFFQAERDYWQRRNSAARWQKARQDSLGLGWANHDHHTYRSSRTHFNALVATLERLGLHCRERFHAGHEAGWGAQVMEQPVTGIVVFADVDMSPDEAQQDFAHEPMPERDELGTVGLWTGLHGESMLEAGLHHLECEFDHDRLTADLEAAGYGVMDPFTNFPFLRQAFTEGERWTVREERIRELLEAGRITEEQAARFRDHGVVGSHLENLERNDGYKGFNQQGVSDIIRRTDARLAASEA